MELITAYKTIDGSIFGSKSAAEKHEAELKWANFLNEFLKKHGGEFFQTSIDDITNIVKQWEHFKADYRVEFLTLGDLPLTARSINCLKAANIRSVKALLTWHPNALLKVPNLGRRSLNEIIDALALYELQLANPCDSKELTDTQ